MKPAPPAPPAPSFEVSRIVIGGADVGFTYGAAYSVENVVTPIEVHGHGFLKDGLEDFSIVNEFGDEPIPIDVTESYISLELGEVGTYEFIHGEEVFFTLYTYDE